jgi:hypothetical protein
MVAGTGIGSLPYAGNLGGVDLWFIEKQMEKER